MPIRQKYVVTQANYNQLKLFTFFLMRTFLKTNFLCMWTALFLIHFYLFCPLLFSFYFTTLYIHEIVVDWINSNLIKNSNLVREKVNSYNEFSIKLNFLFESLRGGNAYFKITFGPIKICEKTGIVTLFRLTDFLQEPTKKLSCQKKSKGLVRHLKIDIGHSMIVSIHFTLDWLASWINSFMLNQKRIINNYDIDPNVIVKTWNLIVIKENINMFFFIRSIYNFLPFSLSCRFLSLLEFLSCLTDQTGVVGV